ncbi:MAG: hypothetical protein DRP71_08860 [Verrucomicrobia bacterium]|nr:MAG: hypothetical protein DRP71_08860 [Verrucomicrobiota bacterium]
MEPNLPLQSSLGATHLKISCDGRESRLSRSEANDPICRRDRWLLIGGAICSLLLAQSLHSYVPRIEHALGLGQTVQVAPDGRIYVGGHFSSINGVDRSGIARFNSNGSLDPSFNAALTGSGAFLTVTAFDVQPDGKIIIKGNFTHVHGVSTSSLVRLNIDGSLDDSFSTAIGSTVRFNTLKVLGDGKIMCGGSFSQIEGLERQGIVRLDSTGAVDESFVPDGLDFSGAWDIEEQDDGKYVVAGWFDKAGGAAAKGVVRLNADGSRDATFAPNLNDWATTVLLSQDGKVTVGGSFTSAGGISHNSIVRLNADGTIDDTFAIGFGFNAEVQTLVAQSDGKMIAVGKFSFFNQTPTSGIARLNADGTLDQSFDPGTGFGYPAASFTRFVYSSALLNDDRILLAGNFISYNGAAQTGFAALSSSGQLDPAFDSELRTPGEVHALLQLNDGRTFIGGDFNRVDNEIRGGVALLKADGTVDTTFNPSEDFDGVVKSLARHADGKVVAGGDFTKYGSTTTTGVAQFEADGALDTDFAAAGSTFTDVLALAVQSDGKVIAGGKISNESFVSTGITRLNTDGSKDDTFNIGTGFDVWVESIAIQSDGKILAGGFFSNFNGSPASKLARLNADGTRDAGFASTDTFDSWVNDVKLAPDNTIYVAGTFRSYGTTAAPRVARLLNDGTLDATFSTGPTTFHGFDKPVHVVAIRGDQLITGGAFTSFSGSPSEFRNYIAVLNDNGTLAEDVASHISRSVFSHEMRAIAVAPSGRVLVGGMHTEFTDRPPSSLLEINLEPAAPGVFPHPEDFSTPPDGGAAFSIGAAGSPTLSLQWQRKPVGSDTWSDITNNSTYAGATSLTLTITGATLEMNGDQFRCTVSNDIDPDAVSNAATLTISEGPVIGTQPSNQSTENGADAQFAIEASGEGTLSYQWQRNPAVSASWSDVVDGGAYSGATSPTLTVAAATPEMNGDMFRCIVTDANTESTTSSEATLTVTAPPQIETQPQDANVAPLQSATFSVTASGSPAPGFQWQRKPAGNDTWNDVNDGGSLSGTDTPDLVVDPATEAMSGDLFRCVVSNGVGDDATSDQVSLTVYGPTITEPPPESETGTAGGTVTLTVTATGPVAPTFQWYLNSITIPDATESTYTIPSAQPFHAGTYTVEVTSDGVTVVSRDITVTIDPVTSSTGRLINLSTRALALTDADVLIPGFVLSGTGTKRLLIRVIGPRLGDFGLTGFLENPQMVLNHSEIGGAVEVATNDDWETNSNAAEIVTTSASIGAFDLVAGAADAVLMQDLGAGQFTVVGSGVGDTTGVALVELYDADASAADLNLVNISIRAFVGTGKDIVIPGFVVSGGTIRLLIRAVGPTLGGFGVLGTLADPKLTVFTGPTELFSNDDWQANPAVDETTAATAVVGAFDLEEGSGDAAVVATLLPGAYTVKVFGIGDTTGVALVEIYIIP